MLLVVFCTKYLLCFRSPSRCLWQLWVQCFSWSIGSWPLNSRTDSPSSGKRSRSSCSRQRRVFLWTPEHSAEITDRYRASRFFQTSRSSRSGQRVQRLLYLQQCGDRGSIRSDQARHQQVCKTHSSSFIVYTCDNLDADVKFSYIMFKTCRKTS